MEALDTQPLYSSDLGPEPCSCDEALALRAELDAKHATLVRVADEARALRAELADARRRIANQAESLKVPRLEDVVEIQRLKGELARTRFLSVLRGKLGETWARMLDKERTELAEAKAAVEAAEKRACDEALTHDNLLEEVESYRNRFLAEQEKRVASEGRASLNFRMYDKAAIELAEAKRAAETWEELCHGQEALGRQADALVERFKALALDAGAKMNAMEVSMNAAYTERNRLVALVARICKPTAGIRRTPIEGWNPEWTNCVFIDTSQGQMSWHYHDSDAMLFADLPAYEKPWDGHTTAEKYERLWRLTELTAAIP